MAAVVWWLPGPRDTASSTAAPALRYVGVARLRAAATRRRTELWRGSHHDLAMQEATEATVLGDFATRVHLRRGDVRGSSGRTASSS